MDLGRVLPRLAPPTRLAPPAYLAPSSQLARCTLCSNLGCAFEALLRSLREHKAQAVFCELTFRLSSTTVPPHDAAHLMYSCMDSSIIDRGYWDYDLFPPTPLSGNGTTRRSL
jgi:hypothetical protein